MGPDKIPRLFRYVFPSVLWIRDTAEYVLCIGRDLLLKMFFYFINYSFTIYEPQYNFETYWKTGTKKVPKIEKVLTKVKRIP